MIQILDTFVLILFVLFLLYIFRGYHLTRLDRDRTESPNSSTQKNDADSSEICDKKKD